MPTSQGIHMRQHAYECGDTSRDLAADYAYIQYNEDVLNDIITTGKYIKLACLRMKSWFNRDDIYFDYDDVDFSKKREDEKKKN